VRSRCARCELCRTVVACWTSGAHRVDAAKLGTAFPHTIRCRGNRSSLRAHRGTRLLRIVRIIEPGLSPELTGDFDGVDPGRRPPGLLIAGAMDRAMMRAAERDGEFIAGLAAERPRLQVAEMMRIGLFAAAEEACLLGNVAKVLAVSIAPRCRNGEYALVDALGLIEVAVSLRTHLMDANMLNTSSWGSIVFGSHSRRRCELR
jgi:hypothetical protein